MAVLGKRTAAAVLIVVLATAPAGAAPVSSPPDPASVVIVANRNSRPSRELARFYAQARGVPTGNICLLDLPEGEVVARSVFELRLREALQEFLRRQNLVEQVARNPDSVKLHETAWTTLSSKVQYVVLMRGVPLRVEDTRWKLSRMIGDRLHRVNEKDTASVDSELALVLAGPYGLGGNVPNPLYGAYEFEDVRGLPGAAVVVARMDGPDDAVVKRMVEDGLRAERYGLLGRAYFDSRAIRQGGYFAGDYWIREAYERFLREGFECVLDSNPEVWGVAFPMENAAVYMGWYAANVTGPFTRPGFRFAPGAIAGHIHSGSAVSLRTRDQYWAGPLLACGAAATWGAVSEPFLSFMPHLDVFADRLCSGVTFGESVYMSMPALSWQVTVVGDPLFAPFRHPLDEQIRHLEEDGAAGVEWAHVRKINLMVRDGRFNPALGYCREKLDASGSIVLREKLGDLYARNELYEEAGAQYERVLDEAKTAETAIRVGARWMLILRLLKQDERAARIESALRDKWKDSPVLPWLDTAKP